VDDTEGIFVASLKRLKRRGSNQPTRLDSPKAA
jgi:hypothetical protein